MLAVKIAEVIFFFVVMGGMFVLGMALQRYRSKDDRYELEKYRGTYLKQNGYLEGYGQYMLISLDGGLAWYAYDIIRGKVVILGAAEEKFPGLLEQLRGLDELTAYVRKHGAVTLSGGHANEEIAILKRAGFEVKRKDE